MNTRNRDLIAALNPRRFYPRADDKAVTKEICRTCGIPVPQTYALIERFGDLGALAGLLAARSTFVVKPARGSGGRGILMITGRQGNTFATAKGEAISPAELRYHLSTILSGLYSLGGHPDRVIIEQLIFPHPVFDGLAVEGTPDIRIIVYRGVPVMAMLRLPTRASRGRANLHQGAAAAGIDRATGQTFGGVCQDRATDVHPDTGRRIADVLIPHWNLMLETVAKVSKALELGYVGVDLVLDADHGPVVMEANVRPGLAIQIANRGGLLRRLREAHRMLAASPP